MTTHTWLVELRTLGVQLFTDGVNLTIDAPKGVMTPDLWEQLSQHKQELITQLGLTETPLPSAGESDEDEQLHAFASTISHLVDVLGGPVQVQIIKHTKGLTLEQYARTIRPPYQPRTLPALPRLACPHQVMGIKREKDGDHQVAAACQGKPLSHGWCEDHVLSHDLLCLGAFLGYPEVVLGHREIGEGIGAWEAHAQWITRAHLQHDIASIRARFRVTSEERDATQNV